MNNASIEQRITDLFTHTHRCAELLDACLKTELDCLKNSLTEQLLENNTQKQQLMNELSALEAQRKTLTTQYKIDSKQAYLNWLEQMNPGLSEQWHAISSLIRQCQKQNATNGIISEKLAQTSLEILNILRGQPNTPLNNTYNASGKKPESSSSLHNTTA